MMMCVVLIFPEDMSYLLEAQEMFLLRDMMRSLSISNLGIPLTWDMMVIYL